MYYVYLDVHTLPSASLEIPPCAPFLARSYCPMVDMSECVRKSKVTRSHAKHQLRHCVGIAGSLRVARQKALRKPQERPRKSVRISLELFDGTLGGAPLNLRWSSGCHIPALEIMVGQDLMATRSEPSKSCIYMCIPVRIRIYICIMYI